MPDGDTNETSNAPVQDINETGASSVSQSTDNLLSNLDNVADSVTKLSKHVDSISTIATYTHTAVNESKNDIKNLSSIVDNNKTVTQQKIIEIIQDINELKNTRNNSDNISNTEISSKNNTKIQEDSGDNEQKNRDEQLDNHQQDEQKDDNSDVDKKKQFMAKVARMVIAMLPSSITNQNSPKSKLDEKTYNVRIKSFSPFAEKQLIDNLKKTLKIEKRKESFVTKSNIIKLAILAFTGMLIYVIAKIKEIKDVFSEWIKGIYDDVVSIKNSIIDFFNEQIAKLSEMFITPLTNVITKLVNDCIEMYNNIKEPLKNIFDGFGNIKTSLIEAYNYIKNISITDIITKLFTSTFNALKTAINTYLNIDLFKIEKEEPQGDGETDETSTTSNDLTESTNNSSLTPQSISQTNSQQPVDQTVKADNNIINNTPVLANHQTILKDGDVAVGGSVLKLQNGTIFNLHKNDDIYIANKPGGVIHGLFEEINSNYTNVKNIFIENFNSIISNIENQDQTFNNLINKLNIQLTPKLSLDVATSISNMQNQINILSQQNISQPITYTGVSTMRSEFRKHLS